MNERLAALSVITGLSLIGIPSLQQTSFRSLSTSVSVNVSVLDGRRPVPGLGTNDFVLTDNGVVQSIQLTDVEDIPVDVTLVLDLSGSASDQLEQTREHTRRILTFLRPIDRIRILSVGRAPQELIPLAPASAVIFPNFLTTAGSAVYDTIAAAFITKFDPGRRRLIVAVTDGADNASVLSLSDIENLARRSDAVLSLLLNEPRISIGNTFHHSAAVAPGERSIETLRLVAALTGGDQSLELWPGSRDLSAVFKKSFDAFRAGYVLRYTPTGVVNGGWHELRVTLRNPRGFTVISRRGYDGDSQR